MKNLAPDTFQLEGDEILVDHWDKSLVLKAPEIVRNNTFVDGVDLFQRFQGSSLIVGVKANSPEEAVTHSGERK
jgi:hypothetical protein